MMRLLVAGVNGRALHQLPVDGVAYLPALQSTREDAVGHILNAYRRRRAWRTLRRLVPETRELVLVAPPRYVHRRVDHLRRLSLLPACRVARDTAELQALLAELTQAD
jgi:hypothetical protein